MSEEEKSSVTFTYRWWSCDFCKATGTGWHKEWEEHLKTHEQEFIWQDAENYFGE